MRVAVIGAGNGAFATAADLALMGHQIVMFNRTSEKLEPVRKNGGIFAIIEGKKRFAGGIKVTTNPKDAISDAELIVVAVPSTAHEFIANNIGSYIQENQTVLLNPGHTGGCLEFRNVLRLNGIKTEFEMYETMTLTYITRLKELGVVEIYRRSKNILYSALPSNRSTKIETLFPDTSPARNVLETGLSNINAICHPPGMMLNAGWIEWTKGGFHFYTEGMTPSVSRVVEGVDQERLSIMQELGLEPLSFVDLFYKIGSTTRTGSVFEAMKGSEPNKSIMAPPTLDSRYVHEDVGHGLVPMIAIGKIAGVKTPVMESLTDLACIMNQVNYWEIGRSASRLGIDGMNKAELLRLVDGR